jgi:long-chain acyl-CoA synthetase
MGVSDREVVSSAGVSAPSARRGANVAVALSHTARVRPRAEAVVDGAVRFDYATLEARVAGLGGGLLGLGLGIGDVVGVLSLNSHRHLECWLGVPRVGLVLNELNTRLAAPELAFILEDSESRALVVDDAFLELGRELLRECPCLSHLIHASDSPAADRVSYEQLIEAPPAAMRDVRADELAGIFYTGGTTGRPKGVMLTHGNLVANAKAILIGLRYTGSDRYLHAGPMFHLADGASTYAVTWVGGAHVFVAAFAPEPVAAVIESERVTASVLVPTMINLLVNDAAVRARDISSLRCVFYGGSPMPAGVLQRATEVLGCEMVQLYGMTEAAPAATICRIEGPADEEPWATRVRSAGIPFIGVEISVRRSDGSVADVGEVGEVWVRAPNVMAGYWKRAEESAAALTEDGWYRSGDAGRLDADGYLYIVDRVKDMIITGGENVYCAEVESALSSHPAVLEVAVFGVPDDRWVERVHATVVLRELGAACEEDLAEHCRAQIARYKLPRSFDLRAELLPKSGAGKVLKRELRAPYWQGHESAIS